jgi:thioester reductase-like protein
VKVLITGSTGFIGGEILMLLSKDERIDKIYCLIRASNDSEAKKRLEKVFSFHDDFFDLKKVIPVLGDLSEETIVDQLKNMNDVDTVIHSAADTSFAPNHKDNIWKVNVKGATNVAKWAASLPCLKTFVYVGTSWICGCDRPDRLVYEDESPNIEYNQLVDYTRSKTAGEINIRKIIPADKLLIVRPSIIMGDSRPWAPRSFVISWAPAVFDLLRLIPARSKANNDVIPVDYATKAITELIFNENRKYNTYHISSGSQSTTNMELLTSAVKTSNGNKPPFCFIDYRFMDQMDDFSKGQLPEDAELRKYSQHLHYWNKIFKGDGSLRKLLWAINFYYKFVNLGQVFDNSRLLADTKLGLPEPAHVYMGRNREHLFKIDIVGDIDP